MACCSYLAASGGERDTVWHRCRFAPRPSSCNQKRVRLFWTIGVILQANQAPPLPVPSCGCDTNRDPSDFHEDHKYAASAHLTHSFR